jgi:hypothetical protein
MSRIEQLLTDEQFDAGVVDDDAFCRQTAIDELVDYDMATITLTEARRLATRAILVDYYSMTKEELKTAYNAFKELQEC